MGGISKRNTERALQHDSEQLFRRQADAALLLFPPSGTTFVAVKEALADLAPYNSLAIRFTLALVVLAAPALFRGRKPQAACLWRELDWALCCLPATLFRLWALSTRQLRTLPSSRAVRCLGAFAGRGGACPAVARGHWGPPGCCWARLFDYR